MICPIALAFQIIMAVLFKKKKGRPEAEVFAFGDVSLPLRAKVRLIVSFFHDVCQGDFTARKKL